MELITLNEHLNKIISPNAVLQKLAGGFEFTEGPVLRKGALWFTDFRVNRIYRYVNGETELITADSHRTVGMTLTRSGHLLGCTANRHAITDVDNGEILVDNRNGIRLNGTNDIVEHSSGRLYFTDPYTRPFDGPKIGHSAVYCFDGNTLTAVDETLPWPNGLAFSPDEKTLYIIDSKELRLYAMDMFTGEKSVFAQFSAEMGPGLPDGMCVRSDGTVFVAGAGGIHVISSDGIHLGWVSMPEIAANLCMDEHETGLYITASTSLYHLSF
ncbi:MAG: SMP-30/gluconolactonase/LRE family protein [Clostridia bacterium]|nr:SMP-30/gluconolactonase/LRE family protein [Clostridia bacterium]